MDPRAAEVAMEQMRKMSPEQMQEMMRTAQMNPAMMQQAMNQMKNMRTEDWDRAKEQIGKMSPSEMQAQAASANQYLSGQQQYALNASKQLKDEGNTLHNAGQYRAAAEKYERAHANLQDTASPEGLELRRSCLLNLSSCYLNLREYEKCVEKCNLVLAADSNNLKALYRRGQAYMGKQHWQYAASDLERSVRLSTHDAQQQKLIQGKLQEAKDQISMLRASGALKDNGPQHPPAPSSSPGVTTAPVNKSSDDTMAQTAKLMAENPAMAKMAAEQLKSIPPEQLAAMTQQMGDQLPNGMKLTPELAKAAAESFSKMTPEEISRMADMAAAMRGSPGMGPAGPALNPEMMKTAATMMERMSPEELQRIEQLSSSFMGASSIAPQTAMQHSTAVASSAPAARSDVTAAPCASTSQEREDIAPPGMPTMTPEMAKMAAEMMSSMRPEDMEAMTKMAASMGIGAAVGAGGSMPAMTPEMAKMAAEMMGKMSSEDMQRMQQMAAGMGGAGGAMPSNLMSGEALSKLSDPKFMEMSMNMMRSMDQASLVNMMMSSGMCKNEQQAEAMAQQMKGMSDSQMKMMMGAANVMQRGANAFVKTKEALLSRSTLLVAIAVVLLALLLRYLGIM